MAVGSLPPAGPTATAGPLPARRPPRRAAGRRGWPLAPALLWLVVLTQLPFVFTVVFSFQSRNLLRPGSEHWVGLANYTNVFTDNVFRAALLTEIELTVLTVAFAMALGVALAVLLDRRFPGRGLARTLLISPFLVMPAVAGLLWKTAMFDPVFGLVNYTASWFGVQGTDFVNHFPVASVVTVLVWEWTPFMMLIVLAGLQSQPTEILEAARVDGAGPWATFRWITLPYLRRYIELGVLLGAIHLVNTFDVIYMMTQGGPGTRTTNLPYYIYQRAFLGFDVGQSSALGVVTVAGTLVAAALALRLLFTAFTGTGAGDR
ncbi:carbohydrate ABC transporter permease [Streptomyces coffeae]|uniref:Sugar ABC transporter permease n=1 Tax=Streptomyces coffeae TaxID=621382 RepID=A0ABS1NPZ4_9ACTN|nr:sugar ABC transporter permease [Streptomyces coffeae]MBL1101962.1 sugar ABC transporter permease [Streptomyces coffeae]